MKANRAVIDYSVSAMSYFNSTTEIDNFEFENNNNIQSVTNGSHIPNISNETSDYAMASSDYKHPPEIITIYIIAYGIAFLFALFGNVIVIAVVLRYRWMHTVTNFFIVNLAIADILVALFCIPITLLTHIFVGKNFFLYITVLWQYHNFLNIFVTSYIHVCYNFFLCKTYSATEPMYKCDI